MAGSEAKSVIVFVSDDGDEHVATAGSRRPSGDQRLGHGGGIIEYGTFVSASEDGDRVAVVSIYGDFPESPPGESTLLCDAG